ncbi:hypothetical protein PLESTB_001056500 [Pleodorina starrii]|uniref:MYND-type domain-containing protein n=1 Tax=Pleodorina starrii TaxID=330485 RepID=A0A9W6F4Z9_9CHLO|nr:hypothetical protein PLESTM_001274600 [Pleodorina starrii]GLC56025.1 hypothetical protein PLESTB_001056500 [Pleodorina starrii]GLC64010.1 hypothetical protein PLESTF_000108800 [Pleodorina starrii]
MTSITMDPPHVVNTGAGCSACCNVAPGRLLRCGACDSAWYCSEECQRKHFKEHKPFCRALRLFQSLQKDLPPETWPRTARDFYVQRTNCQRILEPMLRRPLSRAELRAILGEAKCSICMRTRLQLARSGATAAAAAAPAAAAANGGTAQVQADAAAAAAKRPLPPKDPDTSSGDGRGGERSGGNGELHKANGTAQVTTTANGGGAAAVLSCCPHCHWGWACPEHRDAYLAGPHAAVCLSYQHMNDSQLLTHRYLTATGRLPNYVPDKLPRPMGQSGQSGAVASWQPVPAGWAAFQAWRPLPAFDQAMMCLLTKRMSQALTVAQALQHHYTPQQLACRSSLEIHVLGASAFEVPADRIWEEILNLMPPYCPTETQQPPAPAANGAAAANGADTANGAATAVVNGSGGGGGGGVGGPRVLHVAFVGPELREIIVEESDGRALPQGTALSVPPPPPGRELLYSYHLCPYQEFAAGRKGECSWRRPDIAVAFNSGISEYDREMWAPALEVLVQHGVPVVFTSYNGEEAAADAAAWRAAGGEVTLGPERNPFRAMEPVAEPSQVDNFYYQNYFWWCGRARGKQQQQQ